MENYKVYYAPKDLIYVKKGDVKSYGEVVVLSEENKLKIEDFELKNKKEHEKNINKTK